MYSKITITAGTLALMQRGEDWEQYFASQWKPLKLGIIRKLGVRYFELGYPQDIDHEHAENVKKYLNDLGLRVSTLMCSTYLTTATAEKRKEIFECMAMAKEMGSKYFKLHTGSMDKSLGFKRSYENLMRNLRLCVEHAAEIEMKILIENCPLCIVYSPDDLVRIFKEINSEFLRCLFDPCNFYVMEYEPYPYAFELLRDYVEYFHIKDTKRVYARPSSRSVGGTPEAHKLFTTKFRGVPMGEGGINYEGLLRELKTMSFDGFLAFEPENVHQELVETWMKNAIVYLESKGF